MKANKILVSALALIAIAACTDKKPEDGPNVPAKSSSCKLTSLTVSTGSNSRVCTVFEKTKEVEVLEIAGYDLSNIYLIPAVSEGATTNIDESKAYDLLKTPLQIVVTAEDGVSSATYTVTTRVPDMSFSVDPVWQKTAGSIGYTNTAATGGSVAFAGTDKFVIFGGDVLSVEDGTKIGSLCTTGIEDGAVMYNIANDENGVVIANYVVGEAIFSSGEEHVYYGYTYAWVDGWDKAPTAIYSNKNDYLEDPENGGGNVFGYMSCGGDVKGDFLLTMIFGGRGATTNHHVFSFKGGDLSKPEWHQFTTEYVSNDGNWGQMISPTSGNPAGWFVIGDSMGNNKGYHVYTRKGIIDNFDDNELWGTTWPDGLIPEGYGDDEDQRFYGNYSTGHVRGFQFKGVDYVIATTTGWPCTYLTIQSMYPEEQDENCYLLRTQQLEGAMVIPSSAYIYDEANERGLVITNTNTNFYLYEIVGDFI